MQPDIAKHITQTYLNLRVGMAAMALLLPLLLMAGSWLSTNVVFQSSISAFYHTPMRNLFVGLLVAVGSFLYLYKGFSNEENIALNFAGVFSIGVAFLPTGISKEVCDPEAIPKMDCPFTAPWLHGISAVLFFLCIAYVCIYRGKDTVELIRDNKIRDKYFSIYRIIGFFMVALPLLSVAIAFFVARGYWLFIFEFAAIWVFAIFWLAKVKELEHHPIALERKIISSRK